MDRRYILCDIRVTLGQTTRDLRSDSNGTQGDGELLMGGPYIRETAAIRGIHFRFASN